jgi:hypothetical protein
MKPRDIATRSRELQDLGALIQTPKNTLSDDNLRTKASAIFSASSPAAT